MSMQELKYVLLCLALCEINVVCGHMEDRNWLVKAVLLKDRRSAPASHEDYDGGKGQRISLLDLLSSHPGLLQEMLAPTVQRRKSTDSSVTGFGSASHSSPRLSDILYDLDSYSWHDPDKLARSGNPDDLLLVNRRGIETKRQLISQGPATEEIEIHKPSIGYSG